MFRQELTVETRGRGTHEITQCVQHAVERSGCTRGLCHEFIHHTSASFTIAKGLTTCRRTSDRS